jgi:hypothetical protein
MPAPYWLMPLCLTAAATLFIPAAAAGVTIESSGADGTLGRVLISGDKARVETGREDYWLLLDLRAGTILAVNDVDRIAMDMRSPIPQRSEHGNLSLDAPPLDVRLERREGGPVIAGYRTVHYRVTVDGRHCYDEYLAPDALADDGIRRFVDAMSRGSDNAPQRVLIQLTAPERICEAADDLIDDYYPVSGIPMRTLDADGRVVQEITRIAFDEAHAPALFELPDGYPVLTRTEVMERMIHDELDLDALQRRLEEIERRMHALEPGHDS